MENQNIPLQTPVQPAVTLPLNPLVQPTAMTQPSVVQPQAVANPAAAGAVLAPTSPQSPVVQQAAPAFVGQPVLPTSVQPTFPLATQAQQYAIPPQPVAVPSPYSQPYPVQPAAPQQSQLMPQLPMPTPQFQTQAPPQYYAGPQYAGYPQAVMPGQYPPAGGYFPQQFAVPAGQQEEKTSKTLKALHRHEGVASIVVVIIALVGIAFNVSMTLHVYAARRYAHSQLYSTKIQTAQQNFGATLVDRPDGTLDMSKRVNGFYTAKAQNVQAKLNQQVNFYDGTSFIVTGYEQNWQDPSGDDYDLPAGDYYVKVDMTVGNRQTQANSINYQYKAEINGQPIAESTYDPFDTSTLGSDHVDLGSYFQDLNPGTTVNGAVILQVPQGTVPDLHVEDDGYSAGSGEDGDFGSNVIMQADVKL